MEIKTSQKLLEIKLVSEKSFCICENSIVFFTKQYFIQSVLEIVNLKSKNQIHVVIQSSFQIKISKVYMSEDESRLLIVAANKQNKSNIMVMELKSNFNYPTYNIPIQPFNTLNFYSQNIFLVSAEKILIFYDSIKQNRKEIQKLGENIKKIVVATHNNSIIVLCQRSICLVSNKFSQDSQRKVKSVKQQKIDDLTIYKDEIYVIEEKILYKIKFSYFDDGSKDSKTQIHIFENSLKEIRWRRIDGDLQLVLLYSKGFYIFNVKMKKSKNYSYENLKTIHIIQEQQIWIQGQNNTLYNLSKELENMQLKDINQKLILSKIQKRYQNKQKQTQKIKFNLNVKCSPLFYNSQNKPLFYGSQFVENRKTIFIYKYMDIPCQYFEVEDVAIRIRQIEPQTKEYIPKVNLELTSETCKNLKNLIICIKEHIPILLEGGAGCGKTSNVQLLAAKTNTPLFRINMNNFTAICDILGKSKIDQNNDIKYTLSNFTLALQKGYWILIDQANLSKDQVLNVMEQLFAQEKICIVNSSITGNIDQNNGILTIKKHPLFHLFFAQNPGGSKYSSRNTFSQSLMSNFACIKFPDIPDKDLIQIVKNKLIILNENGHHLWSENKRRQLAENIIQIYRHVRELQTKQNSISNLTIRDLIQITDIIKHCYHDLETLAGDCSLKLCFTQTLQGKSNIQYIFNMINSKIIFSTIFDDKKYFESITKMDIKFIKFQQTLFSFCDLCHITKKPGLLYGVNHTGKLTFLLKWIKMKGIENQNVIIVNMTKQTIVQDLLGNVFPNTDQNLKQKYIFRDGPVTKAIKQGKTLILKGINKVQAAVSQSLNGILQTGQNRAVCIYDQFINIKSSTLIFATANIQRLKEASTMSPALLSRFFSIQMTKYLQDNDMEIIIKQTLPDLYQYKLDIIDKYKKFVSNKLKNSKEYFKSQFYFYVGLLKKFYESQILINKFGKIRLKQMVIDSLQFCLQVTQTKKISIKDCSKYKYPFQYYELMQENFQSKLSFTMTPSRILVANAIIFCMAVKLSIVLEGKAGIGKSKIIDLIELMHIYSGLKKKRKIISINKTTTINDLIGTLKLTKESVLIEEGPLTTTLQKGMIVLLDQFNLASEVVQCFVEQLLSYPQYIVNPISGTIIKIHKNFRILGTQNPSTYAGREQLPISICNKLILIEVPIYSKSEIVQICSNKLRQKIGQEQGIDLQKQKIEYLVSMFAYIENESQKQNYNSQYKKKSQSTTLRIYIKLCKRLRKLHLESKNQKYLNNEHWKEFMRLNSCLVFPENILNQFLIKIEQILIYKKQDLIIFQIRSKNCRLAVDLPLNTTNKYHQMLIQNANSQNQEFKKTLCNLAFCKWFKQNALLVGQTSHKTTVVTEYFKELIKFTLAPNPLTTIYLSNLTQMTEILGSTQPHTQQSYLQYLVTRIQYFQGKRVNVQEVKKYLQKYASIFHQKEIKNFIKFIEEKQQFFTTCQRNLLPAIRYGGIVFLKNINLIDQSRIQGLNSLLQIDQSFTFQNQQLHIHPQLMIIASIHQPTGLSLSPALISRFCEIRIKSDQFMNQVNAKIKKENLQKQTVNFIIGFITNYKQVVPDKYKLLNQKHLANWFKFQVLKFQPGYHKNLQLVKFIIGAEILFIENLSFRLQVQVRTKILDFFKSCQQVIQVYELLNNIVQDELIIIENKLLYLKYMRLSINKCDLSKDFIFSKTAVKNLFRFLCASYTNLNLNLKGPPGIGKTAICEIVSKMLNKVFVRICCSESMQIQDLFGTYTPVMRQNKIQFVFRIGKLLEALQDQKNQAIILFDQINLAPGQVLSGLLKLINSKQKIIRIKDYNIQKGNTIFICAMNPPDVGGGRKQLPDILTNQLCSINLDNLSTEQLIQIVTLRYNNKIQALYKNNLSIVIRIHTYFESLKPNIRHFQNLSAIISTFKVNTENQNIRKFYCALACILVYSHLKGEKQKKNIQQYILEQYGFKSEEEFYKICEPLNIFIQNGSVILQRNHKNIIKISRQNNNQVFQTNVPIKYSIHTMLLLQKLLLTIQSNRVLLIQGKRVSGKTSLLLEFARLINRPYLYFSLNYEVEIGDFLGSICPTDETMFPIKGIKLTYLQVIDRLSEIFTKFSQLRLIKLKNITKDFSYDTLRQQLQNCDEQSELKAQAQQLLEILQNQNEKQQLIGIKFKFNAGIIRFAMKLGYLLILDNIDLAKPVVIQRFNSLGQEGGKLHINEVGTEQLNQTNNNFRILATCNPDRSQSYPLSGAFLNRVIKIEIPNEFEKQNYSDHILAVLNSETEPNKICKHFPLGYKLSILLKQLYKQIHQKKYPILKNKKVMSSTINQKNILFIKRIMIQYGVDQAIELFLKQFEDISVSKTVDDIKQLVTKMQIQRPKAGNLINQDFQSNRVEQDIKLEGFNKLNQLVQFLNSIDNNFVLYDKLKLLQSKIQKNKIEAFDDFTTYKIVESAKFILKDLEFSIQQIQFFQNEKKIILKGSVSIEIFQLKYIMNQCLNQEKAKITIQGRSLTLQNIDKLDFFKNIFKKSIKDYFDSIFKQILNQIPTITYEIELTKFSFKSKFIIKFKKKIKIFNFADIKQIQCEIGIQYHSIKLSFTLVKDSIKLGSHQIQLTNQQKCIQYETAFEMNNLLKLVDIPEYFSFIPITNLQLKINIKLKTFHLVIYSKEQIQILSSHNFSIRNPYFSIQIDQKFQIKIDFAIDLFFNDQKLVRFDLDFLKYLGKKFAQKKICFDWQKSQKFDIETQIIPVFQRFNVQKPIINLIRTTLNSLNKISFSFEMNEDYDFILDFELGFTLNKGMSIFEFKTLTFQVLIDTDSQNYELFVGGNFDIKTEMLHVNQLQLEIGCNLNYKQGIQFNYNFNPPINNISDLIGIVIDIQKVKNLALDKLNIIQQYIPLKQIFKDNFMKKIKNKNKQQKQINMKQILKIIKKIRQEKGNIKNILEIILNEIIKYTGYEIDLSKITLVQMRKIMIKELLKNTPLAYLELQKIEKLQSKYILSFLLKQLLKNTPFAQLQVQTLNFDQIKCIMIKEVFKNTPLANFELQEIEKFDSKNIIPFLPNQLISLLEYQSQNLNFNKIKSILIKQQLKNTPFASSKLQELQNIDTNHIIQFLFKQLVKDTPFAGLQPSNLDFNQITSCVFKYIFANTPPFSQLDFNKLDLSQVKLVLLKLLLQNTPFSDFPIQNLSFTSLITYMSKKILNRYCGIKDGELILNYNYISDQSLNIFGWQFIELQNIHLQTMIQFPKFNYMFKLYGDCILFKGLALSYDININNDQWSFNAATIQNKFDFSKIISYFLKEDINIQLLNKSLDNVKKFFYDIKSNQIEICLGINLNLDCKLFLLKNCEIQYKGQIGKNANFKAIANIDLFNKPYEFIYEYKEGSKLQTPKRIDLFYEKTNFTLSEIFPNNLDLVIKNSVMQNIKIQKVQFAVGIEKLDKFEIAAKLLNGKFTFKIGNLQIALLINKLDIGFEFAKNSEMKYNFELKTTLAINKYQIGFLQLKYNKELKQKKFNYEFNKIDTKQLCLSLIQKELSFLPQTVEIDIKNSDFLMKQQCSLFELYIKFQLLNLFSDLNIKNCQFLFIYKSNQTTFLKKISGSKFKGTLCYKNLNLCDVSGVIIQFEKQEVLNLKIQSSRDMKLSEFFRQFFNMQSPPLLNNFRVTFKFQMKYRLFKKIGNVLKSIKLEASSKFDQQIDIWKMFKLNNVEIKFEQKWELRIIIEIFKQKLILVYKQGKLSTVEQIVFQFNKIIQCISPKLAKIFNFKMALQTFQCDFSNSLHILMKSPPQGGEWLLINDSKNKKLLYLNKLKFELIYNHTQNKKALSLQGSFFIGQHQLIQIQYNIDNKNINKKSMVIKIGQQAKYFDIRAVVKTISGFQMDFLKSGCKAQLYKIDYDDNQSKFLNGIFSKWTNYFDCIKSIQLGIRFSCLSFDFLPFDHQINEIDFTLKVTKQQSGIKKIFGSQIKGKITISGVTFTFSLKIDEAMVMSIKNLTEINLGILLKGLTKGDIPEFIQDKKLKSVQLVVQFQQLNKSYCFKQIKVNIGMNLEIIKSDQINLIFKNIEICKKKQSKWIFKVEMEFMDQVFKVICQNNSIKLQKQIQKKKKSISCSRLFKEKQLEIQIIDFIITQTKNKEFIFDIQCKFNNQISSFLLMYSLKPKYYIILFKSTYFPEPYFGFLKVLFGVKQIKTSCSYYSGNLQSLSHELTQNQKINNNVLQIFKKQNYDYLLNINSKIKIDNIITRFLNKHEFDVDLLFQKTNKSWKICADFGKSEQVFQSHLVPCSFHSKIQLSKQEGFEMNCNAHDDDGKLDLKIIGKNFQNFSIAFYLELKNLFDILNIKVQYEIKLQKKKQLSLQFKPNLDIQIIPLQLKCMATAFIKLSRSKFKIQYIAFHLENLKLGDIIKKLFEVEDKKLLTILSWFPTVKKFQILCAGNITDIQGQKLSQQYVDKGFPDTVYPLHKFFNCKIQFLNTQIDFSFQFSIKKLSFKLLITPIKILNCIQLSGFNNDSIQVSVICNLELPKNFQINYKNISQTLDRIKSMTEFKFQAKASIKLKISDLIQAEIYIELSQKGFISKFEGDILGINFQLILQIGSSNMKLKAKIGQNTSNPAEKDKTKLLQKFQQRQTENQDSKDQYSQQLKQIYKQNNNAFYFKIKNLEISLQYKDEKIQIEFIYDIQIIRYRKYGKVNFSIALNQNIISKFINYLMDLLWPDFYFWASNTARQNVNNKKNGKPCKSRIREKVDQTEKNQQRKNEAKQSEKPLENQQKIEQKIEQKKNEPKKLEKPTQPDEIKLGGDQPLPENYTVCFCGKFAFKIYQKKSCKSICKKKLKCQCNCEMNCHEGNCICQKQLDYCYCKKKKQRHKRYDCGAGCPSRRKGKNCFHKCEQKECHEYCNYQCKQKCGQIMECGQCKCQKICGSCTQSHSLCQTASSLCYCGKVKKHAKKTCGKLCNKKKVSCGHLCNKICHKGRCQQCQKTTYKCYCGTTRQICSISQIIYSCEQKCKKISSCGHLCSKKCHSDAHQCSIIVYCFCKKNLMICKTNSCDQICNKQLCPHLNCSKKCHLQNCLDLNTFNCKQKCHKVLNCGHNCELLCSHQQACLCTKQIQILCPMQQHKHSIICGQKIQCQEQCQFTYPNCNHLCKKKCKTHTSHDACLQKIEVTAKCYKHQKIQKRMQICSNKYKLEYSCMSICNQQLKCKHKCRSICHIGQCQCTQSTCSICSSKLGVSCNGQIKRCKNVCKKQMKCQHTCKQICHIHDSQKQFCLEYSYKQCYVCKNHSVKYICNEGYDNSCPQKQQQQKIKKKKIKQKEKEKSKQELMKQQDSCLLQFSSMKESNKVKYRQRSKISNKNIKIDKNLIVNNVRYTRLLSQNQQFLQLFTKNMRTNQNYSIVSPKIRILIDFAIKQTANSLILNEIMILLEIVNIVVGQVQIIVTGDVRFVKPYYIKHKNEPLNIDFILSTLNNIVNQKLPQFQQKRVIEQSNELDLIIYLTQQSFQFQQNILKKVENNKLARDIYILTKQITKFNLFKKCFQNCTFMDVCSSIVTVVSQYQYLAQETIFQPLTKNAQELRQILRYELIELMPLWTSTTNQEVINIPYSKLEISDRRLPQNQIIDKITLPQLSDVAIYAEMVDQLRLYFQESVQNLIIESKKMSSDIFTKFSFANTGNITEKSIIRAQSTNFSSPDFYEKKIAGPKHLKPTFLVIDFNLSLQIGFFTKIFPTILYLIFILQKIEFPFGIIVLGDSVKYLKKLSQKLDYNLLFQAIYQLFTQNNTIIKLANGIRLAMMQLGGYSQKDVCMSIIAISNSYHMLPNILLTQIQQDCIKRKINLNSISFLKYSCRYTTNFFYLESFKQIDKIFNLFYKEEQIQQLIVQKIQKGININVINLSEICALKKDQIPYKQFKLEKQYQKKKFLNYYMQYFNEVDDEFDDEIFDQSIKIQKSQNQSIKSFLKAFRELSSDRKLEMTALLQQFITEMIKKILQIPVNVKFSIEQLKVLISTGTVILENNIMIELQNARYKEIAKILQHKKFTSQIYKFQNMKQFFYSLSDYNNQLMAKKTDDSDHFFNEKNVKYNPNLQRICGNKTVIYRQIKDNRFYNIMLIDVPLNNQKFVANFIPGHGNFKKIPRYALANPQIYSEIRQRCEFTQQFDCFNFSPHDITSCMNLQNNKNQIDLQRQVKLQLQANQIQQQFYVRSLKDEIDDIVIVRGNIRYLCFSFNEIGQQIQIQQLC